MAIYEKGSYFFDCLKIAETYFVQKAEYKEYLCNCDRVIKWADDREYEIITYSYSFYINDLYIGSNFDNKQTHPKIQLSEFITNKVMEKLQDQTDNAREYLTGMYKELVK